MNYKHSLDGKKSKNVFGVDLMGYDVDVANMNIVYEQTEVGHLEEFINDVSTHIWIITEGTGTFVIDDEPVEATATDIIAVPPGKRIHYFGNMKMVLITTPGFDPQTEHHIRDVSISESPYK
jgi:mannose-6-phosphate isomerase-like protein (cupin superfamily)